ncbi:thermonuclease family protein [Brucella tritici]|uniref:Thermonuclease family protein n=2 Tax=Brucella tritici TaxID=94626 RepID=A0A833CJ63_9HYPH|nr:thermonuclease family protein [Brucella tritici]KAB2663304.1 thermonuclease family protein [Brucella tritici]
MRLPRLLLSIPLLFALPSGEMSAQAADTNWPICGRGKRITCIVDGDTFWMDRVKYRLQGVNAPEAGDGARCAKERNMADAATVRLQELMQRPGLTFQRRGNDRYGRVLVTVRTADGEDVAALMVKSGHGRTYYGGYHDPMEWCRY